MKSIPVVIVMLGLVAACGNTAERKPFTRNVAIVVYENAEPLDWTGPFEVYNDAANFGSANGQPAFNVYIVSKTTEPVNAQGLKVVPQYSIENAPKPDIVLFPGGPSAKIYDDPAFFAWAKKASKEAEIAQSVCTGAFVLAKAGMLDGFEVTTHYGSIDALQKNYPKAQVKRGRRFVDNGQVITTAGISAGIDGSLHVVARLLGRRVADDVATYMEYHWSPEASLAGDYSYLNPSTNDLGRKAQAGDIQYSEKQYAEAEATYREILKEDPANKDVWSSLGWALSHQNEHLEAGQCLAKSVEGSTDRHAGYTYFNAAAEYAQAKHNDEALDMLKKAYAAGFSNKSAVNTDERFASLRSDPRLKDLMAANK
jgi:putative intracellular protease/amidase